MLSREHARELRLFEPDAQGGKRLLGFGDRVHIRRLAREFEHDVGVFDELVRLGEEVQRAL